MDHDASAAAVTAFLASVALFLLTLLAPVRAFAADPRTTVPTPVPSSVSSASSPASSAPAAPLIPHRPIIALQTASGDRGPLVLASQNGALVGQMTIANEGGEPLVVSRVAIRGDDDDVRAPPRLSVRFTEGAATSATIPAGGSKALTVQWLPARDARVRQAFAHVVVTSNDEQAGEVAIGVRGQIPWLVPFVLDHALSLLTFVPAAGALLIVLLFATGRGDDRTPRLIALACTASSLVLALWVFWFFRGDVSRVDGNDGLQFVEHAIWVRALDVEYFVGVDGMSMPMVLLTSLVAFVACVASESIVTKERGYYALFLLLLTGMLGIFVSLDLFLFYVFWGVMLLPVYFLIGIWGGLRKEHAATKVFFFSLVGSVLMLLAFLALYTSSDHTFLVDGTRAAHTWSIPELARVSFAGKHLQIVGLAFVKVVWVLLFLAFAITIPMFPFHTWLPDALVQAPTPVGVLIAGVLVKMGEYGLLRVSFAILPEATRWASAAIVAFGVVNVVYGALCAMAQDDLKRTVAYSSVSLTGFCLIGLGALTPQGIAACLVQMVSHGVIVSMLLLLVGALYDRARTRSLRAFGGLASDMPLFAGACGLALMASLGLPGLSGFWGEALSLVGAFPSYRALTSVAAVGLVLSAAYQLGVLQRLLLGDMPERWRASALLERFGGRFPDLTAREIASLAPLAAVTIVLGVWPVPLFSLVAGAVRDATSNVNPPGPDQIALLVHAARYALAMLP